MSTIRSLFDGLQEDKWRGNNDFSQDIRQAHAVLHHPFSTDREIRMVVDGWCVKRQPCNFGRIAGKYHFIHLCILRERDILLGDAAVREKIKEGWLLWKRRAILDTTGPPHSFMLLVCSPRVAMSAPDTNLKLFAEKVRDLAGWRPARRQTSAAGEVSSDALYLRNPTDKLLYGFQFNVDFFAAAGDGRWWHDHRIPGGIGFTANSTGHMRAWQEWYSEPGADRGDWFLTQAMYTVAQSHAFHTSPKDLPHSTPLHPKDEGRITWLSDLQPGGRPLKESACPFKGEVPGFAEGKDWTAYEGLIHTDHSVRPEFFNSDSGPPTIETPYLNDFTYLYETRSADHLRFVRGVARTEEEVYAELGRPETWNVRGVRPPEAPRSPDDDIAIRRALAACELWTESTDLNLPSTEF